jgi:NADPH:quinone reductase-like Zn-dependent oxidoreductase
MIGVLSGIAGEIQIGHILHKALTLRGIYVGSRAMFSKMIEAIARNRVEPIIDHVFSFNETHEAFHHLQSGHQFGKIVVRVD